MESKIKVEVGYALADRQVLLTVELPQGLSVHQAIAQSGILSLYPQIDLKTSKVGVFGKICSLDTVLHPDDRVEIYRPLGIETQRRARRLFKNRRQSDGKPF